MGECSDTVAAWLLLPLPLRCSGLCRCPFGCPLHHTTARFEAAREGDQASTHPASSSGAAFVRLTDSEQREEMASEGEGKLGAETLRRVSPPSRAADGTTQGIAMETRQARDQIKNELEQLLARSWHR
jgi:hypothetical protein